MATLVSAQSSLARLARTQLNLATSPQFHRIGLARSTVARRCAPGGPWQYLLPGVVLIQTGEPSSRQRILAGVLYAAAKASPPLSGTTAALTGEAALTLYQVRGTRAGAGLVDVLIGMSRKTADTHYVRMRRTRRWPATRLVEGIPCVRPARAACDFAAHEPSAERVRSILANAVQRGTCRPDALLAEFHAAHTLRAPSLRAVAAELVAGVRSIAEGQARDTLLSHGVPDALWNPSLFTPDGEFLASPDGYWPYEGVALEVDSEEYHLGATEYRATLRRRMRLEAQGVDVVSVAPALVRDHPEELVAAVLAKLRQGAARSDRPRVLVRPR